MKIQKLSATDCAKPLLSIAIPTYNRAVYLKELLNVLIDQVRDEPRIELIISDNATPDETPIVVEGFIKRGLNVRYLRNRENIGPDANFLQCFEMARGKYVWIFGDDDIIVPGGISKILALLTGRDYSLVYLSPYWFEVDHIAERKSDQLGRFAEEYRGGLQFIRRVGAMISFISSMIVNKEQFLASTHNKDFSDLVGTSLLQLGYLLPVLDENSKNLIVWERLVGGRALNTGGFGICQVFGINLKRIIEAKLSDRKEIAKELENRTLQGWFPNAVMMMRRGIAPALKRESDMRGMLEPYYRHSWRYWVFVFPLLSLPMKAAELWLKVVVLADRARQVLFAVFRWLLFSQNFVKQAN